MKNRNALLASLSLLFAVSPVALADTGVAPKPEHRPEDISRIDGKLVEVGDHNKYTYRYKRYNVAGNPLSAMMGIYGLQGSMALSHMIALRGDVTLYANDGTTGSEFTGSVAVYFRKMYSGLFLEPGIMGRALKSSYSDEVDRTFGLQTLVGYHWIWDSGLNVSAAFGGGRNMIEEENEYHYDDDDTFVNGYLRFGYAF